MLGTGRGGQDSFGPYEPVPGWPKDISTLPGNDENHFGRPTFMAFLPDAIFVADGYFNSLHGIDVDPASGRVYISDRQNNRMQVFTSDGDFVMQWPFGPPPSDTQYLIVAHDAVWVIDAGVSRRPSPARFVTYSPPDGGNSLESAVTITCYSKDSR